MPNEFTVADFNPSDIAALSAEQKSAFVDILVKAGFDQAAVNETLGHSAVATENNAQPAMPPPMHYNVSDEVLSPEQTLRAMATLRESGVSEEILQAALNGQSSETPNYNLNYGSHATSFEDLPAFNAAITKGFAAGGIQPNEAQPMLDAMLNTMDLYGGSANEKLIHANETALLNRLDSTEEILRTASIAYNALPADFRNNMAKRHAFDSAAAYLALSRVGQMMEYRNKGKN